MLRLKQLLESFNAGSVSGPRANNFSDDGFVWIVRVHRSSFPCTAALLISPQPSKVILPALVTFFVVQIIVC